MHEARDLRELVEVDELDLVGDLVIVGVPAGRHEDDGDAVARVVVVVGAAVVLLGMAACIVLEVEHPVELLLDAHLLDEVTELRGELSRADELEVVRTAVDLVACLATADHIEIELRDDLLARHCGVIGEMLGAEQPELLAGMPDEDEGTLGLHALRGEGARHFERAHRARPVVIGAVVDGVHARRGMQPADGIHVHGDRFVDRLRDQSVVRELLGTELEVEGAGGVAILRHGHAHMVAMRTDGDILRAECRITAAQHGDDVVRLDILLAEGDRSAQRSAFAADGRADE